MKTTKANSGIPDEVKAALRKALDNLSKGIRDPEAAKTARARMDHLREGNRRLFGEQNIAVELIRETREHR